jgi:Arc/MetJ-type ribon-helix-helix transcriptional regulator
MATAYNLTPDEAERLDRLVATGDYPSREAVVSAGLKLLELERWNVMVAEKAAESRADIAAGLVYDADEVFDELLGRYRNWPR